MSRMARLVWIKRFYFLVFCVSIFSSCTSLMTIETAQEDIIIDEDYWKSFNEIVNLPATNWIATSKSYVLKVEEGRLMHSNDLGKHWKTISNPIEKISFVHWFSDGSCLICSPSKAYYTEDFDFLYESNLLDYDGTRLTQGTGCHSFFHEFNYASPNNTINNKEFAIWTDYDNGGNYISRLWYTDDKGKTVKCILKNTESIIGGEVLNITHFHDCIWDSFENCLWVTTGDFESANMLIKGVLDGGEWRFCIISRGSLSKFGQVSCDNDYLYLVTDITNGDAPRGLIRVNKDSLDCPTAYKYMYKNPYNIAFIQFYDDGNGHRILFPDGAQSNLNKFYYAYNCYDFRELSFSCSDGDQRILGQIYGPNDNGDIIAITYGGYGGGYTMNMKRYMLSSGLKAKGLL